MNKRTYLPPSVFQDEKQNIHFDVLMEQVQTVLQQQSGDLWTDVTAHDPGITLLEALAYNVSDLAYRHLLPLVDLLTPAEATSGDTLFPPGFDAEHMLTTSPITAEDYRKGILDLYYRNNQDRGVYYFCDAELLKQVGEDRYRYFYDSEKREFFFNDDDGGETTHPLYLNGTYHVRVKVNYLLRDFGVSSAARLEKLNDYLAQHRNLCEQFRRVTLFGESSHYERALVLEITASAAVTDEDTDRCFLDIFLTAQRSLYPAGERLSAIDFSQKDYTGPRPQQGWIVDYPPARFAKVFISASQVKQNIEVLPWVARVDYISFALGSVSWIIESNYDLNTFWSKSTTSTKAAIDNMVNQVTIKRGEKILRGNADRIYALLQQQQQQIPQLPSEQFLVGRYRNTAHYYPASDMLPALYDLQLREPEEKPRQLHQFLLPFEQQLADGCAQLAHLPELLNFSAFSEQPLWGHQWPFSPDTISDNVHRYPPEGAEYKSAAIAADIASQQNIPQQITLASYLQRYFGLPNSENIGLSTDDEFLQVQRAYLRSLPETGYARTVIHVGKISSLQRRVAARLGIGARLFEEMPDAESDRMAYLSQLPFYIIEHPLLMPREPGSDFITAKPVSDAEHYPAANGEPQRLLVTAAQVLTGKLQAGQLVDLLLEGEAGETLTAILVVAVSGSTFTLYIDEHEQLRLRWQKVVEVAKTGELQWRTSNLWLKEMEYRLVLGDQSGVPAGKMRITTAADQPWPPTLLAGDTLELERRFMSGAITQDDNTVFTATVDSVDAIKGEAVIALEDATGFEPSARYQWLIREGAAHALDRFSFTLSFVFQRSLIMQGEASAISLAERETRIKRIIQEEIPAHLLARVLWLTDGPDQQFGVFGATYARWQNNATRLGADAYNLLRMLSIGMLPSLTTGIGVMHIATDDEFAGLPPDNPARQQYIDNLGLSFVPDLSVTPTKK
jgi:hypothetical protein